MYPDPGRYTRRGGMDPGEQITGTRDEHYNLVSVLYHALHAAENCETYALDAAAAGRADIAAFFSEAQVVQVGLAERAKELLGIGGVVPEPGGVAAAPGLSAEVETEVPPEGITGEEVPPETVEVVLLVAEVMTPEVVTVEPSASIAEAAKRMIQEEKGPLPVVEGDRPVGMVTDRDIIARVVAEERDPGSLTVGDIATRELVTISSDQDVGEAAGLMDEHQLDRILVVEGERLVGIISEADIRLDEGPLVE
jgi:CBS domain-containing protein